jgi:hypothetical protein
MSKLTYKSTIERTIAAGAGLRAAATWSPAVISQNTTWLLTGGAGDNEAPKQAVRLFSAVTGDQAIDLSAVADGSGGSLSFANLRYLAVTNLATNSAHSLSVGAHATTPFFHANSIMVANTTVQIVWPGSTLIFVYKPLGVGVPVTTAINLKLACGANTFSFEVDIKGY